MTQSRPVRALQVVDGLGMGGAETWLMELLRYWSKSGAVQMDFLATGGQARIFDGEARQLGAKIFYIRYGRAHLPQFVTQFRRVLREGHYDAIHDHADYASGWHFLMGAGALPPVRVTHVHNPSYQIRSNYGVTAGRRLTIQLGRLLIARLTTHIAATSRQMIREYGFESSFFSEIPKGAIYCGFQPERFVGDHGSTKKSICAEFNWPQDAKIVLFVGRADWSAVLGHPQNHKNSAFAVSVAIEAARLDGRVHILFAGELSPAVPILEQRIAAAGFSHRLRFVGVRADVGRLMLGSDALLFPSRGEGLGMAAVEAQAAGLPVVASDSVPHECVVVPELVRFLRIEAGEAVWASELLRFSECRQDNEAANRRVMASPFAIETSARALLDLYVGGAMPERFPATGVRLQIDANQLH